VNLNVAVLPKSWYHLGGKGNNEMGLLPLFPKRTDFINSFSMWHDFDNSLLHNGVQAMFVELSKLKSILKKRVEIMTDIERISVFLRYADNPEYRNAILPLGKI